MPVSVADAGDDQLHRPGPRRRRPLRLASHTGHTRTQQIHKKVLDANGNETQVDLAGFSFKIVDANSQQIGPEFSTDSAGHALSEELPVGQPFTLVEFPPAPPLQPAAPIAFTLNSARTVIAVTNQVPPGSTYNP